MDFLIFGTDPYATPPTPFWTVPTFGGHFLIWMLPLARIINFLRYLLISCRNIHSSKGKITPWHSLSLLYHYNSHSRNFDTYSLVQDVNKTEGMVGLNRLFRDVDVGYIDDGVCYKVG